MPSVELLTAYARFEPRGRPEMERALGSVKRHAIDLQGALDGVAKFARRALLVGAGITGFSLKMAANAEAAASRFKISFGAQSKAVEEWAKNYEKQTGRTAISLKPFLADVGAMVKPLGASGDEVVRLSERITRLGLDLASFKDVADEEAMTAVISGLFAGEAEGLRRFGANIMQAKVDAELVAMGYQKSTKGATDYQKVLARLNIVLRETAIADNNLADTKHEANNQLKALTSQYQALMVELGTALLPTLVAILPHLVDMAKWMAKLVTEHKDLVPWVVKWGGALLGVATVLPRVVRSVKWLTNAINALTAAEAVSGFTGMFAGGAAGGAAGKGALNVGRRFLPLTLGGAARVAAAPAISTAIGRRGITGIGTAAVGGGGALAGGGSIAAGIGLLAIPLAGSILALDKNTKEINAMRQAYREEQRNRVKEARDDIQAQHKAQQEEAFAAIDARVQRALAVMPEFTPPEKKTGIELVEREMLALERGHGRTMERIHELEAAIKQPGAEDLFGKQDALMFYQERLVKINDALRNIYEPIAAYRKSPEGKPLKDLTEGSTGFYGKLTAADAKRAAEIEKALSPLPLGAARKGLEAEWSAIMARRQKPPKWVNEQAEAVKDEIPTASRNFIKTAAAGLQEAFQQQTTAKEQMQLQKDQLSKLGDINKNVELVVEGVGKIQPPGFQ